MLSLAIHHNIRLNADQRMSLHEGNDVDTIGVSVPVWFMDGVTTEPGRELFCKYRLRNPKSELPIRICEDGYEIFLPYREGSRPPISDEEWRRLSRDRPDLLDEYYDKWVPEVSSRNLLDPPHGGGSLAYRESNKVKRGDHTITIMHFVCISSSGPLNSP